MIVALEETHPFDFVGIGLLLALAGGFLLANVVLFRHPRALVADYLGEAPRRLSTIREHLFRRVQLTLGFVLLLFGFGFQLFGHYRDVGRTDGGTASVPWLAAGIVLCALVVLELALWLLSRALYRRTLREHFLENPPDLESDLALARELGELYGVESREGDSVQSFLLRIRQRIGLPSSPRLARQGRRPLVVEAEEEVESSS